MPSPSATKASDKQKACRKLTSLLQKDYGKSVPSINLPVLETMLFAACLEDNAWSAAQEGYDRLLRSYYDLNEIRVSSVREIEETLSGLDHADWKGLRIRSILRFVFESTYSYDYEKLKRLTQDSAQKRLKKIDYLTPFIRNFTVQQSLAGFLLCLDQTSTRAAIHLGLVPPGLDEEAAGEYLKQGVKKAESPVFAYYLRCLAVDPRYAGRFDDVPDEDEFDVSLSERRFQDLKKPPKKKPKKTVAAKPPVKKKPAKAAGKKKTAALKKTSSRPSGKKTTAKKKSAVAKKKPAKKKSGKTTRKVRKPAATTTRKKSATKKGTATKARKKKVARKRR